MKAIEFPEHHIVIAKDQPQYQPLPAHIDAEESVVTFCWKLDWRERFKLLFTGKLWHQVMTFEKPLQPIRLLTRKPLLRTREQQMNSIYEKSRQKPHKQRSFIGMKKPNIPPPKEAWEDGSFNE